PGHSGGFSFSFGRGESAARRGQYEDNADGTLTSPDIDLGRVSGPVSVDFNYFLQAESGYDFATVQVVDARGVSSVLASSLSNGGLDSHTTGWEHVHLDLSAFAGQHIQLQFHFTSDDSVSYEGWYVDDVMVQTDTVTPGQTVTVPAGQTGVAGDL